MGFDSNHRQNTTPVLTADVTNDPIVHRMPSMTTQAQSSLPASPDSAARARAFLRENATLDSIRHAEADLLVTELVANVVQHSPDAAIIVISLDQNREHGLIVRVTHPHSAPIDTEKTGTGFFLMQQIARSWGQEHNGSELTVWFSLRSPGTMSISDEVSDEDLFARMAEDPASYSDELVRRHTDLAASISRRYRGKGIDEEDLLQVANMALLKAIQRYDPSIGTLRPYAAATISGELKRLLRDRGWSVRVPRSLQERALEVTRATERLSQDLNRAPEPVELAVHLDLTEDEVIEALDVRHAYTTRSMDRPTDDSEMTILDRLEDDDVRMLLADDRLIVEEAMSQLPEREQRILQLRFADDMTQSEIAEEIGISQMHVSRLLARALETLKETIGTDREVG